METFSVECVTPGIPAMMINCCLVHEFEYNRFYMIGKPIYL
jgi:hypothetical protein